MVEVGGGGGPKKMGGKFQRGGGGVTKKPKQSKVGSKVRRANKKAADAGPREAEMLVPGARKSSGGVASSGGGAKSTTAKKTNNSAEVTDLETVDWDKVAGWQTVKYDPNRLIFGAQEEGFVELEEMDMKDLGGELNALLGARSGAVGTENENNASKKKKAKDSGFETAALDDFTDHDGDFDEDDPAHFPEGVDDEDEDGEDTETRTTKKAKKEVPVTPKKEEKKKAKKEVSDADLKEKRPKTLSAKDARVEKRKLRWKEKVEAAKLRKKYAREELEKGGGVSAASTGDGGTTDSRKNKAATRDATDDAVATTADPVGKSKLEGWHMDYNNYPTSGMGAVVDGVDLDTGVDVSSWLQFDLHPKLLRGLQDLGFSEPTPIQSECLNPAIKGRCDVIGAAETGSGKTLAFGIPILHRLLTQMDQEREESESESDDETPPVDDAKNADEEHDPDDPFANVLDESGRTGATAGFKLPKRRKALRALIVAPTRELAMQVCDMLLAIGKHAPEIGIVPVVGGMSLQKQERLLSKRPEIVVATPGRLWELMNAQGHEHFLDLGRLNFLVLDEADRMVERGHFQELHSIIDTLPMPPRVQRPRGAAKATPESLKIFKKRGVGNLPDRKTDGDDGKDGKGDGKRGGRGKKGGNSLLVDGDIVEENARAEDGVEISLRPSQMLDRQTFVFSATLTVPDAVRRKLKKGHMGKQSQHGGKGKSGGGGEGSLTSLMEQVPFYGRVKLVDLTNQSGTVAKRVMESALECTEDERDALLYHILTQQPGLVIVFVNAISALRRLLSLLKILQLPVEGLHGNMQQRQRLKYLDRFRSAALTEGNNESRPGGDVLSGNSSKKGKNKGKQTPPGALRTSVLVATDVAARGIDIKGIDLVVHYQVPQSADTYVHRSGRTGRAHAEGASVLLVTPGERQRYRSLLRAMNRETNPLPAFPTVETAVAEARRRLSLAQRLDKIQHTKHKETADAEWRKSNAAELGITLDSDEDLDQDAVLVFNAAARFDKARVAKKAKAAFAKAKRAKKSDFEKHRDDDFSDSDDGEDGGDDDEKALDKNMTSLVEAGFDQDDQDSLGRLGEHRRLGREEQKLLFELHEMLKIPLGVKAARRSAVASARYPSRGDGAAKMAEQAHRRGGTASAGKDGTEAHAAVDMLKGGTKAAAAFGAAPGGAAGKKRKRTKKETR